jgi:hypothetical protein
MVNKYVKIINILSHKGNSNQNYTEIPPHQGQNGHYQENKGAWGWDEGKNS